jgi:hypothetical protein
VLYPVLAGVLGAAGAGVLACVGAAVAAGRLLRTTERRVDVLTMLSIVGTLGGALMMGQVPFLLGVGFGVAAISADREHRPAWLVAALSVGCSLASPLAGAFLLLSAAAASGASGWRRAWPYGGALLGIAVAAVLGGASGPNPFPWTSFAASAAFAGALGASATFLIAPGRPERRPLLRLAGLLAVTAVCGFLIPNPIGGNVERFGRLIAVPLACFLLRTVVGRRRIIVGLCAACAVVWAAVPVVSSAANGAADPSQNRRYFVGLLQFLKRQDAKDGRLEIPFTREHWEARWVATAFPLARGWERQSDLEYNAALYSPHLSDAAYRRWLLNNAVRWVALPDVPLDQGGKPEAALLKHAPSWLHLAWSDAHWRVWRVAGSPGLVSGPAAVTSLGSDSVNLRFRTPGSAVLRVHYSPLLQVRSGAACVSSTRAGWTRITVRRAGPVAVVAKLSGTLLGGSNRACVP